MKLLNKWFIALLTILLIFSFFHLAKVHATSLEKAPTETTTITAGWTDPENAFADDGNAVWTETEMAEQEYAGFNFNLADSVVVDKVFVYLKEPQIYVETGAQNLITMKLEVKVYNGSDWNLPFKTFDIMGSKNSDLQTTSEYPNFDITSFIDTPDKVNDVKVRVRLFGDLSSSYRYSEFTYLAVVVTYAESTGFNSSYYLFGAVGFLPLILLIALAIKRRENGS